MSRKRLVVLLILLMICIGGILGYKLWNKPFPGLSKDALKVTAIQLFNDFNTDEKLAQSKYVPEKLDSKTLEVSGAIKDTGQNSDGEQYCILNGGDDTFGVKCIMEKGFMNDSLKPGDKVVFRGFCTGFNMDVILNRCQQVNGTK